MDSGKPPLRILHVVHSLDAGGMENVLVNVSRALKPAEFEIHVCCLARAGLFATRFPEPQRVHSLQKKEGFSPATIFALRRQIRRVGPDVIHTHNIGPLIYACLARPGAPILHGEHAELAPAELVPYRRVMRWLLYRRTARVHTVSQALKENLISHGFPGSKIEVILNGVDTARFQPAAKAEARRRTGLPADATLLGLVGRFGPYKRHAELIDAFVQLAPANPSLELLFVGAGGPLEESVRQQAAASPFATRIHFAGFQAEPQPWYRALDLLVLPSINEGLSNALLEAMACAVPALAHTACGNADVITDGADGYLRELWTAGQLRDALASLLAARDQWPALGAAARLTIQNRFGFDSMLAGYQAIYRRLSAPAGRLT